MSVAIAPETLAALGLRRTPGDTDGRDVVLAVLWHQHLHAVLVGLSATTPIRHAQLSKASGLPDRDFRQALQELIGERLIAPAWIPDSTCSARPVTERSAAWSTSTTSCRSPRRARSTRRPTSSRPGRQRPSASERRWRLAELVALDVEDVST